MIETVVYWRDHTDKDTRLPFCKLAKHLAEIGKDKVTLPWMNIGPSTTFDCIREKEVSEAGMNQYVYAEKFALKKSLMKVHAVVSEFDGKDRPLHGTMVFVNGPTELKKLMMSVVVCNGDLDISWMERKNAGSCHHSMIVCNGDVKVGFIGNSVVIASGAIKAHPVRFQDSILLPNFKDFDKILPFCSQNRLGITCKLDRDGCELEAVAKDGYLSKCGLRAADRIIAVNNRRVSSSEPFVKPIVRCFSVGADAFLTVDRQGTRCIVVLTHESLVELFRRP